MKSNIQYGVLISLTLSLVACGGDSSMMNETEGAQEVQTIQAEEQNLESAGIVLQIDFNFQGGNQKRKYRLQRAYSNRSWTNEQIVSVLERYARKLQRYLAKRGGDEDARAKLECVLQAIQSLR